MNLKTKKVTVGSQALSQQNLCGGTTDSEAISPPYLVVYCWRRTA